MYPIHHFTYFIEILYYLQKLVTKFRFSTVLIHNKVHTYQPPVDFVYLINFPNIFFFKFTSFISLFPH